MRTRAGETCGALTWKPVHVDPLGAETDAHVAISSFTHNLDFKVIKPAGGRDWVCGTDTSGIFVCLAMPCNQAHHVDGRENQAGMRR